jgi:hypothetical protein
VRTSAAAAPEVHWVDVCRCARLDGPALSARASCFLRCRCVLGWQIAAACRGNLWLLLGLRNLGALLAGPPASTSAPSTTPRLGLFFVRHDWVLSPGSATTPRRQAVRPSHDLGD